MTYGCTGKFPIADSRRFAPDLPNAQPLARHSDMADAMSPFVDPDSAVACATDRATLWATGSLGPEQALAFDLPIPSALTASPDLREIRATLAWFTPILPVTLHTARQS